MLREEFKTKVARYQAEGNREIIDEILGHFRLESAPNEKDPTTFIADRIGKACKAELKALGYERTALLEYRRAIMGALGIDIFAEPDLKTLVANAGIVRDYLGDAFEALCYDIEGYLDFIQLLKHVITPALEHALNRVDPFRKKRAVVSYINRAFQTEYTRLLVDYNGTKRLGRRYEDGTFYNVYVDPQPPHAWSIVLDRRVKDAEVPALLDRLTKTQRSYAQRAYEVVLQDTGCGEMGEYRVDEMGGYRLKFRYIAKKLDVEESSLRKTFEKIRERTL